MSISEGGFNLHGIASEDGDSKYDLNPAILFKLDDSLLEDVKKACGTPEGCHFLGGTIPKIKLGKRTFDLTISNEAFRHELYTASSEAFGDLNLTGIVGHRAELNLPERKQSVGSDAALATLQNSLASYKQEKEAKSVNINNNVVAVPKHRWEAYHQQKQAKRRGLVGSQPSSPSLHASRAPNAGQAPTSIPASDGLIRTQAMKTPLAHLLAIGSLSREQILEKTRIPKDDLVDVLGKIAKQDRGKWQLVDRAYKDLDVFKFGYQSEEDRRRAIDNAVGAFDRLRIGKDEKIWQMLLPKEDRDKGIVLSKLHLGANGPAKLTPNLAGSPMLHGDAGSESKAISAANTPRLGPSATPKTTSGKSEGGALAKRLLSKDPKKQQLQRAKDEAKEKKRKERDAAASDRESGKPARKKQMTVKNNDTKVKSAEFVRSSSEESEGEVKEKEKETEKKGVGLGKSSDGSSSSSSSHPKVASTSASSTNAASAPNKSAAHATARKTTKPATATASPNASDAGTKTKSKPANSAASTPKAGTLAAAAAAVKQKTSTNTTTSTAKSSKAAAVGRSTPNGLAAPASQSRNQLSPQKQQHRPNAPSPLGAARPRVASDVSERGAVGVQRVRQGAETPKGLGITNGVRKRQDTVTSTESFSSIRSEKMNGDHKKSTSDKARKPLTNGTATPKPITNGHAHKAEAGTKRRAVDSPAQSEDDQRADKHRKTDSSSSESVILDAKGKEWTFSSTVEMVRKFQEDYYPKYTKMYHEQLAMKKRGEQVPRDASQKLWDMHNRLKEMKAQMKAASQQEDEHE